MKNYLKVMTIRTTRYDALRVALCFAVPLFTACTDEGSTLPLVDNSLVTLPVTYTLVNEYEIPVEKLVIRLTSNLADTLLDTLIVPVGVGDSTLTFRDSVEGLRPLRWWTLTARALDANGEGLGYAEAGPFATRGGISRDSVILNLRVDRDILGDTP